MNPDSDYHRMGREIAASAAPKKSIRPQDNPEGLDPYEVEHRKARGEYNQDSMDSMQEVRAIRHQVEQEMGEPQGDSWYQEVAFKAIDAMDPSVAATLPSNELAALVGMNPPPPEVGAVLDKLKPEDRLSVVDIIVNSNGMTDWAGAMEFLEAKQTDGQSARNGDPAPGGYGRDDDTNREPDMSNRRTPNRNIDPRDGYEGVNGRRRDGAGYPDDDREYMREQLRYER